MIYLQLVLTLPCHKNVKKYILKISENLIKLKQNLNVQGFLILAVQNSLLCCLILQTDISYNISFFYHKHWFPAQFALPFTALCYSSSYLPIAVSHTHRK